MKVVKLMKKRINRGRVTETILQTTSTPSTPREETKRDFHVPANGVDASCLSLDSVSALRSRGAQVMHGGQPARKCKPLYKAAPESG